MRMSAFVFVRSNKHLLLQSYSNKFSYDSSLPEGAFDRKILVPPENEDFFAYFILFTTPENSTVPLLSVIRNPKALSTI